MKRQELRGWLSKILSFYLTSDGKYRFEFGESDPYVFDEVKSPSAINRKTSFYYIKDGRTTFDTVVNLYSETEYNIIFNVNRMLDYDRQSELCASLVSKLHKILEDKYRNLNATGYDLQYQIMDYADNNTFEVEFILTLYLAPFNE